MKYNKLLTFALIGSLASVTMTGCASYKAMWLKHPIEQSTLNYEFEQERLRFCADPENSKDIKCSANVSDKEKYQGLSIRHNGLIVSDLIPFWSMRVHDTDGNDLGEYTVINRDTDYYRSARYYQDEMKNEFSPIRKAEQERLKQNSIEAQQNYEILRQAEEKRQYEEFQKAVNRANLNL